MYEGYEQLLDDFIKELKVARDDALRRDAGRIKTWTNRLGSEARAREKFRNSPPTCTGMKVIGVIRKFWLHCQELNRKQMSEPIDPMKFMTDHLRSRSEELSDFLSDLPFWPISKNEYGLIGTILPEDKYPSAETHDELFKEYVKALRIAVDEARSEYGATLKNEILSSGNEEEAQAAVSAKQSLLCSHPAVIEVIRHYFLLCDTLNRTAPNNEFVYPGVFVTEYLSGENGDLFDLFADLSYLPIGLDENDRYV